MVINAIYAVSSSSGVAENTRRQKLGDAFPASNLEDALLIGDPWTMKINLYL